METQELKRIIEALVFAADEPLSDERIAETLDLNNGFDLGVLIDELNREYQESNRAFTIRKVAGGYQIVTQQQFSSWIRKLYLGRQKTRLSHAALETLALIAFKQPISRVDVAQIRGVNSDAVIGTLLERKLITISGRSETVGRPLLYSTTPEFLKYFGINDIADLPKPREIEELFSKEGMPEELLQALSQTDGQLSLPINADGETTAAEEVENKITTTNSPVLPLSTIIEVSPVVDAPDESAEIEPAESPANSVVIEVPTEKQEVAAAAPTPAMIPENSSIDINEKVLAQLEDSGNIEAPLSSAQPPADERENEIAWISLDNDANDQAEHFTGNELSVEDLAETSNALPTFISAAEVVSEAFVAEEMSGVNSETKASSIDNLAETSNDLSIFASVTEVASNAFTAEEMSDSNSETAAKASSIEAMTEDLTMNFVQTDEVSNGCDNFAQETFVVAVEEIVEMAVNTPAAEVQVIEVNDVGFSDEELLPDEELIPPEFAANSANEIDGWLAEELSREEIAEPDFVQKPENFFLEDARKPSVETIDLNANTLPTETEPIVVSTPLLSAITDEITIVNLAEPAIIESVNETTPEIFDDKNVEIEAGNVETPAMNADPAVAPNENFFLNVWRPAIIKNEESRAVTFRERMTGWIKRTFDKLMTLIGAKV